jgi:hypothetical protein
MPSDDEISGEHVGAFNFRQTGLSFTKSFTASSRSFLPPRFRRCGPPPYLHQPMMAAHLNHDDYTIAWTAVLLIEAEAAFGMLDKHHQGHFELVRGEEYIYMGGEVNRHNVVVATYSTGEQRKGTYISEEVGRPEASPQVARTKIHVLRQEAREWTMSKHCRRGWCKTPSHSS